MNDVWLLRSYMGSISSSNQTWAGFGDGTLQSGVNANGQGVTNQYLTVCASTISQPSPTSASTTASPSGTNQPNTPSSRVVFPYDTDVTHKLLSPISVALLLASVVLYRLSLPPLMGIPRNQRLAFFWASIGVAVVAYAAGIVGLTTSFTTIIRNSDGNALRKRASSTDILKTGHGQVGLAFFVALYVLLPFTTLSRFSRKKREIPITQVVDNGEDAIPKSSTDTGFTGLNSREKKESLPTVRSRNNSSPHGLEAEGLEPESPRRRTRSLNVWPGFRSKEKATSTHSSDEPNTPELEADSASPGRGSFLVLNRGGQRTRRLSSNAVLNGHTAEAGTFGRKSINLSEMSWLERRRSLNAVVSFFSSIELLHG